MLKLWMKPTWLKYWYEVETTDSFFINSKDYETERCVRF